MRASLWRFQKTMERLCKVYGRNRPRRPDLLAQMVKVIDLKKYDFDVGRNFKKFSQTFFKFWKPEIEFLQFLPMVLVCTLHFFFRFFCSRNSGFDLRCRNPPPPSRVRIHLTRYVSPTHGGYQATDACFLVFHVSP